MAHYSDLERCTYFDRQDDHSVDLIAVGWLEAPYPYQQGGVRAEFSDRLFSLLESVWDPILFRGKHDCSLCDLGPREMRSKAGLIVDMGALNLFVPNEGSTGLFVAPSLILHYVVDHGYRPPPQFQTAVMTCPETSSSGYFRQIDRIIPTSKRWRDGAFGFWTSMGSAIAGEAGLMSRREYDASFAEFSKDRFTYPPKALPAEPPR